MEKIEGKKILITGGGGFIGSHLVKKLGEEAQNCQITVLDSGVSTLGDWRYEQGPFYWRDKYAENKNDIAYYEDLDIRDAETVGEYIDDTEPDIVVHLAAHLEVSEAQENPRGDLDHNITGTVNVLEACSKLPGNFRGIVNASSACVYEPNPGSFKERKEAPTWAYGVSKLSAEHYVKLYCTNHNFMGVNLRYGIVFGPGEWYGRVITRWMRCAKDGLPIRVFGDGSATRDFVPIDYAVGCTYQKIQQLLEQTSLSDRNSSRWAREVIERYNWCNNQDVGTNKETSILNLAIMISKITGAPMVFEEVEPGQKDTSGRLRLPHEMKRMLLSGTSLVQDGLRIKLEEMWEWVKNTPREELMTLYRWDTERV